jgi:hypothetical protein
LILGIGHAGENWGLGTLYHGRRSERWEKRWEVKVVPGLPTIEPKKEAPSPTGTPDQPA